MSKNNAYYDYDLFNDEEEDYEATDYLYRPLKQNSRKSLAPVFVYLILVNYSGPDHHISQKGLINLLERRYEITIERKALGRIIHGLADSGLGIFFSKRDGCWYDADAERWAA